MAAHERVHIYELENWTISNESNFYIHCFLIQKWNRKTTNQFKKEIPAKNEQLQDCFVNPLRAVTRKCVTYQDNLSSLS